MSQRKKRKVPGTRRRALRAHLRSTPPASASPAVLLGTELRMNAEAAECCVCGATPQWYEITSWDPAAPQVRRLDEAPEHGLAHAVYVHKSNCPAASDAVEAALTGPNQTGGI